MSSEALFTIAILIVATILFVLERLRSDLVAVLVMLSLAASGILEPAESFSGFSSPVVLVLIAAFVISGTLSRVGVSQVIGRKIAQAGGSSEVRLVGLAVGAGSVLSLVMNNVAAAAVLLPSVMDASRRGSVHPSRILLPLAYATQLGGMATLLTTSNLVASATLLDQGLREFEIIDFFPFGAPIAIVGGLYLVFIGRRLLPRQSLAEAVAAQEHRSLQDIYGLSGDLFSLRVRPGSLLAGVALAEADLRRALGLNIVLLEHPDERARPAPAPSERFRVGDVFIASGHTPDAEELEQFGLEVVETNMSPPLVSENIRLVELVLSPRSGLAGKTLRDVSFRERYGTTVVAIWREGEAMTTELSDVPLRFGDGLLVHGTRAEIALIQDDPDFLVLTQELGRPARTSRMVLATTIILLSLMTSVLGLLTVAEALLAGSALLVLTRCISMEEVYRAIEWRAVVLIGAMLPMGLALEKTGAAEIVGDAIATAAGPFGPIVLLAGLVLLTVTMAQLIPGGAAVPLVIIPLAVAAANQAGADPRMFAMAIALAASTAMLTPYAHPVGAMVMGLGGYSVGDYLKTGLPLVIISTILIIVLVPLIWAL